MLCEATAASYRMRGVEHPLIAERSRATTPNVPLSLRRDGRRRARAEPRRAPPSATVGMAMTCQESNVVRTERKVCDDEAADAADCGPAEGSPTTPPSLSDNHIGATAIFIFFPHNAHAVLPAQQRCADPKALAFGRSARACCWAADSIMTATDDETTRLRMPQQRRTDLQAMT